MKTKMSFLLTTIFALRSLLLGVFVLAAASVAWGQSTGTIRGTVTDVSGGLVAKADVTAVQTSTNLERKTVTDDAGSYFFPALPAGTFRVEVRISGFQTQVREGIVVDVNQIVAINFSLKVGEVSQTVTVEGGAPVVETDTITVGEVINQNTVQQIPLNGRHFVDLVDLAPGSVTAPQNGFLTGKLRGQGGFGAVTAGNREDTINFMVNGINLNDPVQNQITFQPSINTVSEFKLSNSTFSSEFGHTSGTVVNIATRSGANDFHGEVFEFLRNDALDAKNFFDNPLGSIPPFKRNQFGTSLGGPIFIPRVYDGRSKTFWWFSYEGLRQRQAVTFNRQVPSQAARATATDPIILKLLQILPRANQPDGTTLRSSGSAPVDINQWTLDISHQITTNDRIHGYYVRQTDKRQEPSAPVAVSTVPGFGDVRTGRRQIFTLNETHVFSNTVVNEARFGFNRIFILFDNFNNDDPATIGFVGLNPVALPEIQITTTGLDFGGGSPFPQGRGDTTFVWSDTLSWLRGKHGFKFGGEIRKAFNNGFQNSVGRFRFSSEANFLAGKPLDFTVLQGGSSSAIGIGAFQLFAQDNYKLLSNLTLELGFRYELNTTPTERFDRFVAFDPATSSLVQINNGLGELYDTNHNFMPRVGFAWDPFKNGKTSVRAGYGVFFDQPVTNSVTGLSSNPPFSNPVTLTSPNLANPGAGSSSGLLSPFTVSSDFQNSYVQNWNFNIEHEVLPNLGIMVGYFGSKGTHLRLARDLNQPVNGVRPFSTITLLDGSTRPAFQITQLISDTNSSYNALWLTARKRFSRGLQFSASYTYSKSIDYNSRNNNEIPQDSTNLRGSRGASDFDARNRFVISYLYEFPFTGSRGFLPARLVEGWSVGGITTFQDGNPVTIVRSGRASDVSNVFNGTRPDVIGNPNDANQDPSNYFNPLAFAAPATGKFGNLGRNGLVVGPGFNNFDFSLIKTTALTERVKVEFRTEFFNLFNHPNLGQPGTGCSPADANFTVSSIASQVFPAGTCIPNASFGTITRVSGPNAGKTIGPTTFGLIQTTRFPTGDAGSARQVQFALKFKW